MHIRPQAQILACGHASARAFLLRAQRSSLWHFQRLQHLRGVKRLKLRLRGCKSGCNCLIFSL